MNEFPTRKGLILGAALVALDARMQAMTHQGNVVASIDYGLYRECSRLAGELIAGHKCTTEYQEIMDLMAHTRQTMRVHQEEWEQCVPITKCGGK